MNVLFIHIPKTAGTSIETALGLTRLRAEIRFKQYRSNHGDVAGYVSIGHVNYRELLEEGTISTRFDEDSFKFCFCRNPYDRAVSQWAYGTGRYPKTAKPGIGFLEFCRQLKDGKLDGRLLFMKQVELIDGTELDFIGRFERLDDDFRRLCQLIKREPVKLPHLLESRHRPYQQEYCDESKGIIREVFADDFERFDYDYNDYLLH